MTKNDPVKYAKKIGVNFKGTAHIYGNVGWSTEPWIITIGDNVYFGNNVIVLPGVTIGSNVVIGAGAVVSRDIPDNSVAVGVPARVIKTTNEYFEKFKRNLCIWAI